MAEEDLKLKILETRPVGDRAQAFTLEKPEGFDYRPGQHLFVELEPDNGKPFSLVSSPTQPFLEFATLIRDTSDFKQRLAEKRPGDELIVSGPYGKFLYGEEPEAVFLAGGIGITPFIGFLRYIQAHNAQPHITLLYSCQTAARIAFKGELDTIAAQSPGIRIVYTLTQEQWDGETGRIDAGLIRKYVTDPTRPTWYLVGPPGMVGSVRKVLRQELQAPTIKLEAFSGY